MAEFDCIVYSKIDTAAVIRLNMPETGNRIGLKAVTEIQNAMEKANSDPIVKSIIITGTGEYFCAGGAIDGFPDGYAMDQRDYSDGTVVFKKALYHSEKPLIAAVNGKAFAGGLTVVEGCDLAVASSEAQFGLSDIIAMAVASPMEAAMGRPQMIKRKKPPNKRSAVHKADSSFPEEVSFSIQT